MSEAAEARRLTTIGAVLALCLLVTGVLIAVNPFRGRPANRISIVMDLPYLGQGVTAGTALIMHGVNVGQVTSVSSLASGGVRLNADVRSGPTAGLTDKMNVDFRPSNYFGVTAINLVAGTGGAPLRNGSRIDTVPKGNFTLQALLYRLGEITGGVVTPQLVRVMDRATRFTDGLNPLIETIVVAAEAVTKVQTVSTEQLLRNTTGVSVAFPGTLDSITSAGYNFDHNSGFVRFMQTADGCLPGQDFVNLAPSIGQYQTDEYWNKRSIATLDLLANRFFGALGKLLSSHPQDLMPAVDLVKTLTDVVPGLITPANISSDLVELRTRLENLYAGSPEQRAIQTHIVLDELPGVAAPLGAIGAQ
ncbi:Mammalian cell entry related domain protein [Mycobacterium palustre]|uniref:Mammalian cell entry related domain protein n=1 Tax=Mycobacterium palustre TaxID=153971 RepID=A0A1X1ZAJ9_9MYCO|nr:Mammalian cell entry related domain protein [Mycobacterium palustre]ORW20427.1 Mammalian cell entry related domain protein [Mycobacterium palustre]